MYRQGRRATPKSFQLFMGYEMIRYKMNFYLINSKNGHTNVIYLLLQRNIFRSIKYLASYSPDERKMHAGRHVRVKCTLLCYNENWNVSSKLNISSQNFMKIYQDWWSYMAKPMGAFLQLFAENAPQTLQVLISYCYWCFVARIYKAIV
jgi:hypothetical protein